MYFLVGSAVGCRIASQSVRQLILCTMLWPHPHDSCSWHGAGKYLAIELREQTGLGDVRIVLICVVLNGRC